MSTNTQLLAGRVSRALAEGDRIGFVRAVKQLIDNRAPMTSGWKSLSGPLFDYGELDLCKRVMDLYASALQTPAAQVERALIYVRCAQSRAALAMLDAAGASAPDPASNAYLRGTIALNLGDRETAREALLRAQSLRPGSGQILQTLSMLGSVAAEPLIAARIADARGPMASASAFERGSYLYALGKMHDDLGEVDDAFAAFAEGAAIIARDRPYDARTDADQAASATHGWSADTIAGYTGHVTISTDRPIVVTGLPRSGSTLVEHILASHSAVVDGDELGRFTIVVNEIGGSDRPALEQWRQTHALTEASRTYLHLIAQRFGKSGRIVDKTLEASRYLGTMATVMPEAPLIWMRRDPLDIAWSCFSTWFLVGLSWSWAQPALAAHLKLEAELLDRWQDILGDRLCVVDYEALVRDKEACIPPILAHCGLPMEAGVLTPEKSERLVTTNSVAQVRAPINTRAIGRGKRYAAHLQPFIDAYGYVG